MAWAVMLLPEPDSPTKAKVCPRLTLNCNAFTACTIPLSDAISTDKSRTVNKLEDTLLIRTPLVVCLTQRLAYAYVAPQCVGDEHADQRHAALHPQKYWPTTPTPTRTQKPRQNSTKSWGRATFPHVRHRSWCQRMACWGPPQFLNKTVPPRTTPSPKTRAPW